MENIQAYAPLLNLLPLALVFVMWTKFDKLWDSIDKKSTKEYSDDTFQRKDLCNQTVETIHSDLAEIKADVKILLKR